MDNNKIVNNNNEVVNAIQKSSNEINANIGATIQSYTFPFSVVNTTPNVQTLVTLAQTLSDNLPLMSASSSILSSTTFVGGFQNNVFFDVVTENSAKQFKLNIINEVNSSNSHNCEDRNSKNINNIKNRSNDTCSDDNQNKNVAFNNYSGAGPRIVSYVENGHLHVDVESVKCTDSLHCQSANPDKKQVANLDRSFDNDQKTNGASKDDDNNIFSYKENEDDGGMIQNTESEFEFESTEADQYKMEPEADQMNDDENCNNDGFENDNINIGCHATNESLNNHHEDSSDEAADEVAKLSFISNINFSSSNNVNRNSIINNTSIVSDTNFAGNSINFINDLKLNGVPHHSLQAVSGGNFIDNAKLFNKSNSNIQNYNHYDNKKSNYFNNNTDKNIVNCNIKDMIGDNKKKDFDSVFDDLNLNNFSNKKVVDTEGLMTSKNSVPDQFTHGKFAVDCLQGDGVFLASCDCEMSNTNNLSINNEKIFDDASAMHLSNKKNISPKDIKCDEPISSQLFGIHLNNEYVTSNCKDGGDNNESSSHGNQLTETQSLPLFPLSKCNSLMASPSSLSSPLHHFKIKASSLVSLEEGAKNHSNKINFFHSNIDDDESATFCSVKHQNKDYFKTKRQWNEISLTSISMDSNMTPSNHFIGDVDVDLNSWDHISSGCARQTDSTNFGTNFSNTSSQKCHFLQLHHANYQPRVSILITVCLLDLIETYETFTHICW
ncbi:hypothetical protein HELRODRAFT_172788 [Helobdella robusta]|uniref:Uncharacterized protein n=1 Tax=Helobdella robusta TaxID=6412 RepID=T1F5Y2_HELRO|nr:hypothetical protein HELRODRAFT_172788 [Helobdella robusta]ESO04406.1 hypothetical protein HELRODRAFT_172788 [Helobdella robusta]